MEEKREVDGVVAEGKGGLTIAACREEGWIVRSSGVATGSVFLKIGEAVLVSISVWVGESEVSVGDESSLVGS